MAKARAKGRPIAPLELSVEERTYLERQVRRHRVARSLSERCCIIVRCADGLPSKRRDGRESCRDRALGSRAAVGSSALEVSAPAPPAYRLAVIGRNSISGPRMPSNPGRLDGFERVQLWFGHARV
jgi:hypothetical protein